MKYKLIYILLLLSSSLLAQTADSLFARANENYRKGAYEEALKDYNKIDSLGQESADLFYNKANTYYKRNQIAPAIYYFEKALLLNPNHEDAKHNLVFANRMCVDAFEVVPKNIFQKINESIIYPVSYNTWAWISVVLALFTAFFFLRYYFSSYTLQKRLYFTLSLLSVFLFILALSFAVKAKHYVTHNTPAIVFETVVGVKSEPTTTASESFQLHEGTKVLVLESVDDWKKIKIPDGKVGWLKETAIKVIQ